MLPRDIVLRPIKEYVILNTYSQIYLAMYAALSFSIGFVSGGCSLGYILFSDNMVRRLWNMYTSTVNYNSSLGVYEIPYTWGGKSYKVVGQASSRGPKEIYTWETYGGIDVTDEIDHKLGRFGDFHGIPTTPKMLGFPEGLTRIKEPLFSDDKVESKFYYKNDYMQL